MSRKKRRERSIVQGILFLIVCLVFLAGTAAQPLQPRRKCSRSCPRNC